MLQAGQPCHYIPLSRNRRFTGRDAILRRLKERLFIDKECQKLAVVGLGGVGKTQVVLQLAYWVKETKPDYSVFWAPALSDGSFEQAYTEIARRLNIQPKDNEDLRESVRRYLELEYGRKWLMIVDNADDKEILLGSPDKPGSIDQYLPESDNGLILFTTRSRELAVAVAGSDIVTLHEMSVEEATEFLKRTLVNKQLLQNKATTEELFHELTYLPLAIAQAAAYLNQNQMSIRKYVTLLRSTEQDLVSLMSREFHDNTRYRGSQNAVATTWLVSFDKIRRFDSNAAKLLSFVSFIEPKAIPQSILPKPLVEEEMEHAIGVLCGYAFLVRREDSDMFDMHRLVHVAIRVWVQKENITNETETSAIQHLASIFPSGDEDNRSLWREYLPHAQHALRVTQEYQYAKRFDLFYRVGLCLYKDRRFKEAITPLEETCQWRKQHLPRENSSRLSSEHTLAIAYLDNRQIGAAIEILEHVVAIQKEMLKEEDNNRLTSEHELASAYFKNRQIGVAIEIFEHIVAIQKEMLKEEDNRRLTSEHMLASAYLKDQRIGVAIKMLEHVVAIEKETLKEEDYDRLVSEYELAKAYLENKQIGAAIELLEHVVAIQKNTLKEEDHSRLLSEHALASAYLENQQIGAAIKILEQVVAIKKETLKKEDHSRLTSEHELASAYLENQQIGAAIKILEHVVAVRKKTLQKEDRSRLVSEHDLAYAYLKDRQIKKSIALLEHVVAVVGKAVDIIDENWRVSQDLLTEAYGML
jgi:tetratricopeptide (TPR) repeat protein